MSAMMAVAIGGVLLAVLVLVLFVVVRSKPDTFRVERSADLAAPADVVFSKINNLRVWSEWSPFEKLDPGMHKTFEGPAEGPGAVSIWRGNSKAGEGRMTILESKPGERVRMRLEFVKPFKCLHDITFLLTPTARGTRATWRMEGKNTAIGKVFSLVCDMDKMVGKDIEEGLAKLGVVAEAAAKGNVQRGALG